MAAFDQKHSRQGQSAPSTFGRLVKRLRVAADLTQEELAERAGVSARLISDLERGLVQRSRRDTVEMLAAGLRLQGTEHTTFVAIARRRPRPDPEPSATLDSAPLANNLPQPPTTLVGREREVSATTSLLLQPETRLLTLSGPGGVGKTRLAIEIASRVAAAFPQDVAFVDLAPLASRELIVPTIAHALKLQDDAEIENVDALATRMQDARMLLLIDNLEHLIDGAPDVARLLELCPSLTILATSREALRLRVEREYPLSPLALPSLAGQPDFAELSATPAVDLFARSAVAAQPEFALTEGNARVVAEITVRLDGLPLAIELAAARMRVLSPAELLDRLDRRLPLLTGGARDLPARQQTLRAAIDWSYGLLQPEEQRLFRRLAVFSGGFTLDAAEFVAAQSETSTLNGLTSLVEKSLIRPMNRNGESQPATPSRFGLLETIREFGLEQLDATGERDEARGRHAEWQVELALQSEPGLNGPEQAAWLARMQAENDNIRAALNWAIETGEGELALRISGPLLRFWATAGQLSEARRWYEQALNLDASSQTTSRAKALLGAEVIAYFQGDYEPALAYGQEALEIYQALGDPAGTAWSFGNLGLVADAQEDYERATSLYERALAIFRELGDRVHTSFMLGNLGLIAHFQGDQERAARLLEEALALARERGDQNSAAITLSNLGLVAFAQNDLERATELQIEALGIRRVAGNRASMARNFDNFAVIAAARHDYERAARLFGAAEAVRAEIGSALQPNDREFNRPYIEHARDALGGERFTELWEDGASMPQDDAIEIALGQPRLVHFETPHPSRHIGD